MNRARTRNTLLAAAIGLIVIGTAGYLVGSEETDIGRVYLANGAGGVLFDHAAHTEDVGSCVACHHTLITGGGSSACADCHDEGYAELGMPHDELLELHGPAEVGCADCHDVAASDQARDCRECHVSTATAPSAGDGSCSACHDDGYERSLFASHGEMVELHAAGDVGCAGCHEISATTDAYHGQCNACHLSVAPDMFGADDGQPRCERCHLK